MATTVWRGHITFGLVSIPVRLYRAARPERVKLREVYAPAREPEPEPVAARSIRETEPAPEMQISAVRHVPMIEEGIEEGREIPRSAVGKAFEVEKGRFVTLDREELRALAPKTSTTMDLMEFVELGSIDPIYFETSYYVQPEPEGEKPYTLLFESLKETGLAGVARIAMHRREHIVIVRAGKSGLIAHTMYFANEVRADEEYATETSMVNRKELDLANTLVRALSAEFSPEKYRDTYREQLEQMIAAKAGSQPAAPVRMAAAKPAVDIMEALRKSLAELKKPAQAAGEPRRSRHRRRG